MRRCYAFSIAILALFGCQRQENIVSVQPISGYRIEGKVTDRIDNPIMNVAVRIFYDFDYVDYNGAPSKQYVVTDSTKPVTVAVKDWDGLTIRILFSGKLPLGPFVQDWDQKDSSGTVVPSSVYSVQYIVNGVSQKSYPVTVSGNIIVKTNSSGQYVIPSENLPVGFYPVPVYSSYDSTYYGNHRINDTVTLLFETPYQTRAIQLTLLKDQVTQVNIVIG